MADYIDLSRHENGFAAEDAPKTNTNNVPNGTYVATIEKTRFKYLQTKPPRLVFEWLFKIVEGEHAGTKLNKLNFCQEGSYGWLKSDIKKCGLQPTTLADIQDAQEILHGERVEIRVEWKDKQGQNRQNVYINRLLKDPNEPPPPEDDIPF